MILQAYDFRELSLRHGCRLQLGGRTSGAISSTAWNWPAGWTGTELFGVTTPLITTADGAKMGKTASGAVWLNADQLPAYDYWQFWRNTADADVVKFLKLFTDLPLERMTSWRSSKARRSTRPRSCWPTRRRRCCMGVRRPRRRRRRHGGRSRKGEAGGELPTLRVRSDGYRRCPGADRLGLCASNGEARRKIAKVPSSLTMRWLPTPD